MSKKVIAVTDRSGQPEINDAVNARRSAALALIAVLKNAVARRLDTPETIDYSSGSPAIDLRSLMDALGVAFDVDFGNGIRTRQSLVTFEGLQKVLGLPIRRKRARAALQEIFKKWSGLRTDGKPMRTDYQIRSEYRFISALDLYQELALRLEVMERNGVSGITVENGYILLFEHTSHPLVTRLGWNNLTAMEKSFGAFRGHPIYGVPGGVRMVRVAERNGNCHEGHIDVSHPGVVTVFTMSRADRCWDMLMGGWSADDSSGCSHDKGMLWSAIVDA